MFGSIYVCLTLSHMQWTNVNPFPHTTILQQTTLSIFCQKIENLYNWMDTLWLKVKNIVAKWEIARFEQFLLFSLCFQKAVSCRSVYMREMVKTPAKRKLLMLINFSFLQGFKFYSIIIAIFIQIFSVSKSSGTDLQYIWKRSGSYHIIWW